MKESRKIISQFTGRFLITSVLFLLNVLPGKTLDVYDTPADCLEQSCLNHVSNAFRAWNPDKVRETLKTAERVGLIPEWRQEFARNLMSGCAENGILLTHHIVDSLPLLYLQIIEGMRDDLAILPISWLDQPWYLALVCDHPDIVKGKPELGLTRSQIATINQDKRQTYAEIIPLSGAARKRYQVDSSASSVVLDIENGWLSPEMVYSRQSIKVVLNLLAHNQWKRPVYISMQCDTNWVSGLQAHLLCFGLGYEILPFHSHTAQSLSFNWKAIRTLLMDPNHFQAYRYALISKRYVEEAGKYYQRLAQVLIDRETIYGETKSFNELLCGLSTSLNLNAVPSWNSF